MSIDCDYDQLEGGDTIYIAHNPAIVYHGSYPRIPSVGMTQHWRREHPNPTVQQTIPVSSAMSEYDEEESKRPNHINWKQ